MSPSSINFLHLTVSEFLFYSVLLKCLISVKADSKAQHKVVFSNHCAKNRSGKSELINQSFLVIDYNCFSACFFLERQNFANLISKLNFYKLIPYPMDNCFTGRRDRSRQTPEKDVLYILPAGPVTECAFARWRIVLHFLFTS